LHLGTRLKAYNPAPSEILKECTAHTIVSQSYFGHNAHATDIEALYTETEEVATFINTTFHDNSIALTLDAT